MEATAAQRALETTGIPPEGWDDQRMRRLSAGERALYQWILKSFAAGTPPAADALADAASLFEVGVEQALTTLAREDLVHYDRANGAILVAYPFSGRPTAHRVLFEGRQAYAMCAIDALGIAPMLGLATDVRSADPLTGEGVDVRLAPSGEASWRPQEAVVIAGRACEGPSFAACCRVLNFFVSPASAERYLRQHLSVTGSPISIPEAIELGRLIFGDLLREV